MNREDVTVLGLGQMGTALADALLAAGHNTTVWNRTPAKAGPLVARGATLAATPGEAVSAAGLVLVCVLDYDAVRALLEPVTGSLAGRTVVNLTSGSPEQARETAAWAAGHGFGYLDGAIMSTPPGVGSPASMFLYSGSPAAFAVHRETLAALGEPVDLGEDPGVAALYDVALLGVMWATLSGWLHATALAGADGVAATAFTPVAVRWLTGAVTGFMGAYAEQVDAGHYPGDDATLDVHRAAIGHLVHAGRDRGIDGRLPELSQALIERAVVGGNGSDSYARLVELFRKG
ncbi:6-phosphogluconate dehydrogenase [Streptomyces agglomeratus]|uniref:6-phosphogluconate dehydrogenase n=1 Tax=Streptomyces agglomeratus TaxID=285458 RepID=A0A1E5P7W0_9ACTN|nr:NAD(P)-binding domain-containing protein [Streptomyces agglomeratus]OEJ25622.1 6-phosphogluconate dehydrogenase [Streptomyces agglomeratus]OEJ40339.1 6-phosphogluconate dehydrogenase [Streptomyces agglomeratus]OEJ45283.1 6-phosphogluconate dehydrogenase [Streptomyces agglomeratus]OEJ52890.1 6-phosphogluconate dehydrogenase [Streptomyces agglomeratus]OEJ60227.1 6-phosphogluconate dehydrogenase [Streptomyces agglomeratus]